MPELERPLRLFIPQDVDQMGLRWPFLLGVLFLGVYGRLGLAHDPYQFPVQLGKIPAAETELKRAPDQPAIPFPGQPREQFSEERPEVAQQQSIGQIPQQTPEIVQERAPEQLPQPAYFPAGHSLYEQADVDEMLNYAPLREQRVQPSDTSAEEALGPNQIQQVQYPFEINGAEDLPNAPPVILPNPLDERIVWTKRLFQTTVLPGSGDQLGIFELDTRATFYPSKAPFLRFTPQYAMRTLSGPDSTDLPGSLYDVSMSVALYIPFNEQWRMLADISPGMYTDFEAVNKDSMRFPARLLGFYRWSPSLDLAFGFVYFDRDTLGGLPAAGLVYTPNEDFRLEVTFPRPKASWRYYHDGDRERKVYVVGEFGGGSWTVKRPGGVEDTVTLNDLRLLFGWEHREGESLHWSLEAGYVFARNLEYRSHIGDQDLDSTALLRFAIGY